MRVNRLSVVHGPLSVVGNRALRCRVAATRGLSDNGPRTTDHGPRRRGAITLELLLVLPILTLVLSAVVQLSMMIMVTQRLAAASAVGARVAAIGGDDQDVRRAVRVALGDGALGQAEVLIVNAAGDATPNCNVPHGEPVEVRVRIAADAAVPDLLGVIGIRLCDETLLGRTVMVKE